ncbi:hypothetical protein RvY_14491 [Ramazzottius varieornatus]|uniref:Non-structural maintenance of chromosomes element 1 homolog n=1 Tax=Ramazzottius varieornatus TaxID=947166 RepID=A0A1D1VRJ0_RAMVA|nr:hypothetical protein RvY_14491 [Ramazzottius varieornatus]
MSRRGTQQSQGANLSQSQQSSSIRPSDSSTETPDFNTYGDFHKAVLSVFLAQSILDGRQVRLLFQNTCPAFGLTFPEETKDYFNAVACTFGTINARIKKYSLLIKRVCSGSRIESYYCLANKSTNSIHQTQEVFSRKELEYLNELVKAILKSGRGHLTDHEAGNVELSSRMTQSNSQEMRKKFVALQFIETDDNGKLVIAPRALAELEPELRRINDEAGEENVEKCSFCQGIIVNKQGVECGECSQRCHPVCLMRVLEPEQPAGSKSRINCSACMKPFPEDILKCCRKMGNKECKSIASEEQTEQERFERVDKVFSNRDTTTNTKRRSRAAGDRDTTVGME